MRILGVDPGLRVTGYGLIDVPKSGPNGDGLKLVEMGVVRTDAGAGIAARLEKIHRALGEAITELKPDVLAIEKLYAHYDHPSTAILMGHARGVVCVLAGQHRLKLASLPSTHVKKAVTGNGHAAKDQVQRMVQQLLKLKERPEPPDVADALAVAIAYAWSLKQ